MYLASFHWPKYCEPLCVGTNKKKVLKAALDKAKQKYGTKRVNRPGAMCCEKIDYKDIDIEEIDEVR
jgi:hypothetical protein